MNRDVTQAVDPAVDSPSLNWYQKISKGEKLFWLTLFILFIFVSLLYFIASVNYPDEERDNIDAKKPIIEDFVIQYIPVDTVIDNLDKNKEQLTRNLNLKIDDFNRSIDTQVDNLFDQVERNLDKFLDFHYSVIGEYTELGAAATGKIENLVLDKLFGQDFQNNYNLMLETFNQEYLTALENVSSEMESIALIDVDREINQSALNQLQKNVSDFKALQEGKLGVLLAARLATKIAKLYASKLALKFSSKFASKLVAKTAAKTAASGTGVTAGAFCGPLVWICSPVAAGTLWVATDLVFVIGDEYFYRDDLKKELISELNYQKRILKNELNKDYGKNFVEFHNELIKQYENIEVVEKKRVKVKDKF